MSQSWFVTAAHMSSSAVSETPFGGPIMFTFYWYLDPLSPRQKRGKRTSELDPLWQIFVSQRMKCIFKQQVRCDT